MAVKYLKKASKNPSTDDYKTRASVQKILIDLENQDYKDLADYEVDGLEAILEYCEAILEYKEEIKEAIDNG